MNRQIPRRFREIKWLPTLQYAPDFIASGIAHVTLRCDHVHCISLENLLQSGGLNASIAHGRGVALEADELIAGDNFVACGRGDFEMGSEG